MSKDGTLPPGVTLRDIDERFGEPKYLRCLGCMLDFQADLLDGDLLCQKCRQEMVKEEDR